MMSNGSHENPQKCLQIKKDDKFFSRLLSKEVSSGNSSSRIYYRGVPSSIPFTWETRPGTPKHALYSDSYTTILPPLTPPPSYYSNTKLSSSSNYKLGKKQQSLLRGILAKLNASRKIHLRPILSLSSSSSSSSSPTVLSLSSPSLSTACGSSKMVRGRRRCMSWSISSFGSYEESEERDSVSPTSTLCFGGINKATFKCVRERHRY